MKIYQVCKEIGITKKAIAYYEKQGLIKVQRDENGYRCFDQSHISLLKEITLYRKLQIPTAEISLILNSESKQKVLKSIEEEKNNRLREMIMHQYYLDKMINSDLSKEKIEVLLYEISKFEEDDKDFIINKLNEFFPGGMGVTISTHFSNFKFDKIQTKEQNCAWMKIVNFLDETDEIEISEVVQKILDDMEVDKIRNIHSQLKQDVIDDKISEERMNLLKNDRNDIYEQIEGFSPTLYKELVKFQANLKEFFLSEGYKTNVVNNMKLLSKEYREYQNKLMKLDRECH